MLHCLHCIDPSLRQQAEAEARIVHLDDFDVGPVFGTTRGGVNTLLYDYALTAPGVTIHFNHLVADVIYPTDLVFDVVSSQGTKKVLVPIQGARVIAADGAYSGFRIALERHRLVDSSVSPWTSLFRILCCEPGAKSRDLDTGVHYSINGHYLAFIKKGDVEMWVVVVEIRDTDPDARRVLLMSKDAAGEKVQKLRTILREEVSQVEPLISDAELRRFFNRRIYWGAAAKTTKIAFDEVALLIGDAAGCA